MAERLRHRGPDGDGFWSDEAALLLHRRLAVVELSPLGAQPMASESGRYIISFNGEIYNFKELRENLIAVGQEFRGNSDTEVLLALVDRYGFAPALKLCVGMFAIALWDRKDRRLSLARDRMGEKPLYYAWCGKSLAFASELKALRAHPDFDSTTSPVSLAEILAGGFVDPAHSIYASARQIRPGTIRYWEVTTGDARPFRDGVEEVFWDYPLTVAAGRDDPFAGTLDDAADALHERLATAIELQSRADVPVGVFLSGGVDSSLVTALMAAIVPDRVRSYSIGFLSKNYDEAVAARAVAAQLGTKHRERYVSESEALKIVPELSDIYDEPFADSSQIPTVILSQLARQDVTVALSGDGADELLGGYDKYWRGDLLWNHRSRSVARPLLKVSDIMATQLAPALRNMPFGGRVPWHSLSAASNLFAERERAGFARSFGMLNRRPAKFLAESVPLGIARAPENSGDGLSYRRAAMLDDAGFYLPGDILTKVDRATMRVSLESRAPFLDHRVVELCARFPDELLFNGRESKRVARRLLYRLVPRRLVDRPKSGFMVPLGAWLRGDLQVWARDLLSSTAAATFLDRTHCIALLDQHCRGRHDFSSRLWPMVSIAAWAVAMQP